MSATTKNKPGFIELKCITGGEESPVSSIVTAVLMDIGFEGFWEEDQHLFAYISEDSFSPAMLDELDIFREKKIKYQYTTLENRNWNEEWEKNFPPVTISNRCLVRAPFHPPVKEYPFDIIIEPKMAFGTGHHPTTEMIAEYILGSQPEGIFLFDMGCGSGILGIIARKAGAAKVEMADIDADAVTSARENVKKNDTDDIKVYLGGCELLENREPDMILANINRSVLIDHIPVYFRVLKHGGTLVISGIIEKDFSVIMNEATKTGFDPIEISQKREWLMIVFTKPE